jgi:UDP-glucose 4-epimerase
MKILVTGSNGYIGKHLCKMLDGKHEVYGLDLHESSHTTHVSKYYQINIDENFQLFEDFDCVIHLAALVRVGESVQYPTKYYTTNIVGTRNVLNGISFKNFVFGSTGAAATPTSPYAISKLKAEDEVKNICEEKTVPYTMFRFYNVTGTDGFPATNPDGLFFKLTEAIETGEFNIYGGDYDTPDGTPIRDYVHVNEICQALSDAIDHPSNSIENLGHGKGYSVKEIVKTFQEVNNVQFKINIMDRREGDPPKTILDSVSPYMSNMYSLEDYLKIN